MRAALPGHRVSMKSPAGTASRPTVAPLCSRVAAAKARRIPQRSRNTAVSAVQVPVEVPAAPQQDPSTNGIAQIEGDISHSEVVIDKPTPNKATILRNIVFVTSEVTPWSKTGGLADVCRSLPIALAARGHRVMVVAPRYKDYAGTKSLNKKVYLTPDAEVGYYHLQEKGVDWVFVDHPSYPRPGGIYADSFGVYGDNQFRYSTLCLAGLEAPLHLDFGDGKGLYGQDCIFVANDWHASLVPVYLAAKYRPHNVYKDARSVLAIHNLRHQGVFPPSSFESLHLPGQWYHCLEWQYPPHQRMGSYAEEGRAVNTLKAGLTTSDRVVTVSAGYAEEIKTSLGGWGMEGLLEQRSFVLNGITNGIDMEEWNPETDPHLVAKYNTDTFVQGKEANKLALQKELGLPQSPHTPLVAFIGRLDPQKGADILLEAAPGLLQHFDMQLVCLGTGNPELEDGLRWLEATYKDRARGWVGFNEAFSHRLTAAADILLMPSRFEPCGLNQLYAMRYGAVPVAHRTGGLRDTVLDYDPWQDKGTGWTYNTCDASGLGWAVSHALKTYKEHREAFRRLQHRGMVRDSSWDTAAQQWEQCFTWARNDPPYCN